MNECYKGGSKHKFKARYEDRPSPLAQKDLKISRINSLGMDELNKLLVNKVYVRDVCEWCGEVVERR